MEFQDVRPQLEKIAGDFQYKDPPDFLVRLQDLISYILRAVADFLKQFKIHVPGIADTAAVGNVMQVIIITVGVVCLMVILIIAASRMKHLRAQAQLARKGALSLEELLDSAGWKQKAEEYSRQKMYKDACRAQYLSVIYLLDEKKIMPFAPTRTNFEYFYALSGKDSLQRGFRRLADLVENMWFGNHVANEDDYNDCVKLSTTLDQEITQWAQRLEGTT